MSDWSSGETFYRVSVRAMIFNEQREIMLVREEAGNDFNLPGGGLDHGETPHDCLVRELREEINLSSPFTENLLSVQTRWLESKKAWLMEIVYTIQYEELIFDVDAGIDEMRWVNPQTIDDSTPANSMIRRALREIA